MYISDQFAPNEHYRKSFRTLYALTHDTLRRWKGAPTESIQKRLGQRVMEQFFRVEAEETRTTPQFFFSGRSALFHALTACGLPRGSTVAVQAFTCTAVITPILACGLEPLYVDITTDDYSMSIDDLKQKYHSGVTALILQHSFGIPPRHRVALYAFCKAHDIWLIEDGAHGLHPVDLRDDTSQSKHAILLSFGRSKLISSVFGACVFTPHEALHRDLSQAISSLRSADPWLVAQCLNYLLLANVVKSGMRTVPPLGKLFHTVSFALNLFPKEIVPSEKRGIFSPRMDARYPSILAYAALADLDAYSVSSSRLSRQTEATCEIMRQLPGVETAASALLRIPVTFENTTLKDQFVSHCVRHKIELGHWYDAVIAPAGTDLRAVRYTAGACPTAEYVTSRIVNIPIRLTANEHQHLMETLTSFCTPQ